MSKEYKVIGEHCLDCSCPENPDNSTIDLIDKCHEIDDLLTCLLLILQDTGYQQYIKKPHLRLILDVQDKIKIIEQGLDKL